MNLIIVLPSLESVNSAGFRIRYQRLSEALEEAGVSPVLTTLDEFDPQHVGCGVVVFSKCYDARSLVCAAVLRKRGIKVGVDLFDDYFSQGSDARLSRFRSWLKQMLRLCDFALCSTAALREIVDDYCRDIPVHLLSDPAPWFDREELAESLTRKLEAARSDGVIRALWFGMGDNPFFPLGIKDLAAFGSILRELATGGMSLELTVLTNARALDAAGLALTAQLPIPVKILEWSVEREARLLEESLVCFVPVSAQPFSVAKSLNRALTALASGCQLLSVGYPLYAPLDRFVYARSADLLADWHDQRLRLSRGSIGEFEARVSEIASAEREAAALARFLKGLPGPGTQPANVSAPIFLLQGIGTDRSAHELVRRAGGFSVGTPFANETLDFDIFVDVTAGGRATLAVTRSAFSQVMPSLRTRARPARRRGGRRLWQIGEPPCAQPDDGSASLPWRLAMYGPLMKSASDMLSEAFGSGVHLISENSPLPVEPVTI